MTFQINSDKKGMKSAKSPKANPQNTRSRRIRRFCFIFLFTRRSTRMPTPEPEKSPESIVPTVMIPSEARVARVTDAAQLGIRPNTEAIR